MKTKQLESALSYITHPSIDATLIELGIISDVAIEASVVTIEFAFPFPNVPVKKDIIDSVKIVSESLGFEFKHSYRTMSPYEKGIFLNIEHSHWKDGSEILCS
jgi:metal-sulfur cluster biosynthetic enzyme